MKNHWKTYLIAILIPLAAGGLSALLTRESMDIYKDIVSPPLAPPSWLFPVVWTLLYILMGVSSARVYLSNGDKKDREDGLLSYGISLFMNFLWSVIFFRLRFFGFAALWLGVMLFFILRTVYYYAKVDKLAAKCRYRISCGAALRSISISAHSCSTAEKSEIRRLRGGRGILSICLLTQTRYFCLTAKSIYCRFRGNSIYALRRESTSSVSCADTFPIKGKAYGGTGDCGGNVPLNKLGGTGISWLMEATRAQTVLVARQAKSCEPETRNQSVPYSET